MLLESIGLLWLLRKAVREGLNDTSQDEAREAHKRFDETGEPQPGHEEFHRLIGAHQQQLDELDALEEQEQEQVTITGTVNISVDELDELEELDEF